MNGRILFNGNIQTEALFVERARQYLLDSPGASRPPRVLLVTAAWAEHEHDELHVKAALNAAGIPSDHQGGYDRAIVNLSAWHRWREFLRRRPEVAREHAELTAMRDSIRTFYLERTAFHADLVRRGIRFAREQTPRFSLAALASGMPPSLSPPSAPGTEILSRALAREVLDSVLTLVEDDRRMLQVLEETDELMRDRTGLLLDSEWRQLRAQLEDRILEADAVMFFGGQVDNLIRPLQFFHLRPAFLEALRRGATFFAVSAGAMALCERAIVYDQFGAGGTMDFRLHDRGLGLVTGLQIFPHCMDRIQTDDPDNLAYLARRFNAQRCVGLNQESFLWVDLEASQATSVGELDGVYVFGQHGVKSCFRKGESIPLGWDLPSAAA